MNSKEIEYKKIELDLLKKSMKLGKSEYEKCKRDLEKGIKQRENNKCIECGNKNSTLFVYKKATNTREAILVCWNCRKFKTRYHCLSDRNIF